jgi:hypothetical protein
VTATVVIHINENLDSPPLVSLVNKSNFGILDTQSFPTFINESNQAVKVKCALKSVAAQVRVFVQKTDNCVHI